MAKFKTGDRIVLTDADLEAVRLDSGSHAAAQEGHCAMEWLSYVAGDPFSDNPPCMRGKDSLRRLAISLNDSMPNELRNSLEFKRAVLACLDAEGSPEAERARAFRAADWAVREFTPMALEVAANALEENGLHAHADSLRDQAAKLRGMTPVKDRADAADAADAACAADSAAYAASRAADSAAYAAYAADAAANAAAYAAYAAAYAAYAADAAANAAAYAAYAASRAAAYAADAADAADAATNAADAADVWKRGIALLHELAGLSEEESE